MGSPNVSEFVGGPACLTLKGTLRGVLSFFDAQCSPLEVLLGDAEKNTTQTREPTGTRTHGQTVKGRLNDTKPARREKRAAFLVKLRRAVAWVNFTHRRALLALGGDQRKRAKEVLEKGGTGRLGERRVGFFAAASVGRGVRKTTQT